MKESDVTVVGGLRISVVISNIGHYSLSERSIVLWSSLPPINGHFGECLGHLARIHIRPPGCSVHGWQKDPNSNPCECMVDVSRESLPCEQ